MIVLASGHLRWNDTEAAFDRGSTAIPAAIAGAFHEEPRWFDLTWFDTEGSLGHEDPRFIGMVADLAAAVRGFDRDALIGESVHQNSRNKVWSRSAVAALALLIVTSMLGGGAAVTNRAAVVRQRGAAQQEAKVATARLLAAHAVSLADSDLNQAIQLAAAGYQLNPDPITEKALFDVNRASGSLVRFLNAGSEITATAGSSDGDVVLAGTADGRVLLWDLEAGSSQQIIKFSEGAVSFLAITRDSRTVVATSDVTKQNDRGNSEVVSRRSASWTAGVATNLPFPVDGMSPSGRTLVTLQDGVASEPTMIVVHSRGSQQTYPVGTGSLGLVVPDDNTVLNMDVSAKGIRIVLSDGSRTSFNAGFRAWMFGGAFSPDGRYFIWSNDGEDWFRMSVAKRHPTESDLVLPSGGFFSKIALTRRATRIATTIQGRIFIGTAQPVDGSRVPPTELVGAGPATPETTHFLSDSLVVSSSGSTVAIWDLAQNSRLAETFKARVPNTCSVCGPPHLAVSPNSNLVALMNEMGDELTVFDFRSGKSRVIKHLGSVGTAPGESAAPGDLMQGVSLAWIDDRRLAVYSADPDTLWVLSGQLLDTIDSSILLGNHELGNISRYMISMGVRSDGTVVLGLDHTLVTVDPATGKSQQRNYSGGSISADGLHSTLVEDLPETASPYGSPSSHIIVEDLLKREALFDQKTSGSISSAALVNDTEVAAWLRDSRNGPEKLIKLRTSDGVETANSILLTNMSANNRAMRRGEWAADEALGVVTFTDIGIASAFPIAAVETGVRGWTVLGFAQDVDRLVLSNAPSATMTRIVVGPAAWLELACRTIDEPLDDEVWSSLTGMPTVSKPTCSNIQQFSPESLAATVAGTDAAVAPAGDPYPGGGPSQRPTTGVVRRDLHGAESSSESEQAWLAKSVPEGDRSLRMVTKRAKISNTELGAGEGEMSTPLSNCARSVAW